MLYPDCVREKPRGGKPKLSKVIPIEGGENPAAYMGRIIFYVFACIDKTSPTLLSRNIPASMPSDLAFLSR
jgi:hypothetical protein